MSADRVLMLKLIADVKPVEKPIKGVRNQLSNLGKSTKSWGAAFTKNLVIDGIGSVTDALGDAIAGFKSGDLAASQLGVAWKNMGFDGSKLSETLQKVTDSTLALGTSDDEAVKVFTQSIKHTGNYNDSLKRLTIAQDLVANGSAPNLSAAMKLIDKVGSGAKGTLEKLGVHGKTAAERIDNLGKKVKGAAKNAAKDQPFAVGMNAIQEAFEGIAKVTLGPILEEVGNVIKEKVAPAITDFANALGSNGDAGLAAKVVALAVAVGLLAVAAYAHPLIALVAAIAALSVVTAIAVKDDWIGQLTKSLNDNRTAMSTGSGDVDKFGQTLVHLGDVLNDTLGPIIRPFFDVLKGIWDTGMALINLDFDGFVKGLGEIAGGVKDLMLAPFQTVWNLIPDGFKGMFGDVAQHFRNGVGVIRDLVNNIIDMLNVVNDFAWPAMGTDVDLGPLADLAGQPRHHWIGVPAGSFQLWPELGHVGGQTTGHPRSHKTGLDTVPFDNYPALLHQNEAVLKASDAEKWRAGGGSGGGGNTYNISLHVDPSADQAAIGKKIVRAIQAYERRESGSWRR